MVQQSLFNRLRDAMVSGLPMNQQHIRGRFFRRDYKNFKQTIAALISIGAMKRIGSGRRGDPYMLIFLNAGQTVIPCPCCKGLGVMASDSAHIPPTAQPVTDEPASIQF